MATTITTPTAAQLRENLRADPFLDRLSDDVYQEAARLLAGVGELLAEHGVDQADVQAVPADALGTIGAAFVSTVWRSWRRRGLPVETAA